MARAKRPRRGKQKKGRKPIIPASNRPEWKTKGFSVMLDAVQFALAVVDGVEGSSAEGIIPLHNEAIRAGVRANDGQPQPPLKGQSKRAAEKGERPDLRGVTNEANGFAKSGLDVVRFSGKAEGDMGAKFARVVIAGPRRRPGITQFLTKEMDKRGIDYLFVDGKVADAIDANLKRWLDSFVF